MECGLMLVPSTCDVSANSPLMRGTGASVVPARRMPTVMLRAVKIDVMITAMITNNATSEK